MVSNLPPNIKIGIVNVSVAGCKIELFDKDNFQTYASMAPSWVTNIINTYSGNPYQYLVDIAKVGCPDTLKGEHRTLIGRSNTLKGGHRTLIGHPASTEGGAPA